MVRGFYTAASGLVTQEKLLNTYANNMANVSTAGYKKDNLTVSTFGEHFAVRMNTYNQSQLHRLDDGNGVFMQTTDVEYVDHTQGAFEQTGRSVDMAIAGEGFFVINTADGEQLTRDGQFALDAEGFLVLPGYGRVQGEGGDIQLGSSFFTLDNNGVIYLLPGEDADPDEEPEEVDRLLLALPADITTLKKSSLGLFEADDYTTIEENSSNTSVMNTVLERSNVNMAEEMTRVMASQRSLQSVSQIVKIYDELNEQSINRLGKV